MATASPRRILILGNSGSGKTTMARALVRELGIPHFDLDQVAWDTPGVRCSVEHSRDAILDFSSHNPSWVIEGCYASFAEIALDYCTELRFLNPGVEACRENCRSRPWEPSKYPSQEEQDAHLDFLLKWVGQYEQRSDEYGYTVHRELFDRFRGTKSLHP